MKKYGKLTPLAEWLKQGNRIPDYEDSVFSRVWSSGGIIPDTLLVDENGIAWHDIIKNKEERQKYYIAVDNDGLVISMETDPESSQLAGVDIIGIDDNFDETYGQGGSVYGKIWDGRKFVTPEPTFPLLTARQFWQAALLIGIREEDLAAGIADEKSPFYVADEQERESVLIDITKATTFSRDFPLLEKMTKVTGMPKEQIDDLWRWVAKLG